MICAIYQVGIPRLGAERSMPLGHRPPRPAFPKSISRWGQPAPLVDQIPRERRAGRPSQRPAGVPSSIWAQWLRNVSIRGFDPSPESFAKWIYEHRVRSAVIWFRSSRAGDRERTKAPEVVWVTVVHRKDLTPDLEQTWRRRIALARPGEPIYRIHLRGVQRREVR